MFLAILMPKCGIKSQSGRLLMILVLRLKAWKFSIRNMKRSIKLGSLTSQFGKNRLKNSRSRLKVRRIAKTRSVNSITKSLMKKYKRVFNKSRRSGNWKLKLKELTKQRCVIEYCLAISTLKYSQMKASLLADFNV